MTENFKQTWAEIESAIGGCCLHKRAAGLEVIGEPIKQLTLVTTAPISAIDAFIGKRKVEKSQDNRFVFTHNGITVDLTTYCGIDDLDELHEKSFRHTLTIDSIGISRNGRISDVYGGVSDARNRIVRLSDEKAVVSETLLRRILQLIAFSGYSVDVTVRNKIEDCKLFEKEGYRKKYCEVMLELLNAPKVDWTRVAALLNVLGASLGHRKVMVNYTEKITSGDEDFKRTFAFLIFALIKVTSKELQPLMKGDNRVNYFDSLCNNLQKPITSYEDYQERKEKYGAEFLESLFDMQELWMTIEGIPYKRPSERDFDRMALLISDDRFWSSASSKKNNTVDDVKAKAEQVQTSGKQDEDEEYSLTGEFDFMKATAAYNDEYYDEPTEGKITDDYVPAEESERNAQSNEVSDLLDILEEDNPRTPKSVSGLDTSGLESYEAAMRGETPSVSSNQRPEKPDGLFNNSRGHKSKVLSNEL